MRTPSIFPAGVVLCALSLLAGVSRAATPTPSTFPPVFRPANFTDSTRIDNPYLPLVPGTILVYEGVRAGHVKEERRFVGSSTSTIAGVTCREISVGVWMDGDVTSIADECYAQDLAGDVWLLGRWAPVILYPLWAGDPPPIALPPVRSWKAGVAGAVPLLAMQAHPKLGDSYFQRDPLDGRPCFTVVFSLTASVHVPYGPWVGDVLVTRGTSTLDPGVFVVRHHAPGVGLLKSETLGGSREVMELVSVDTGIGEP